MPINIEEKTNTVVVKVNTAKILNINIDVENKKIVFVVGFGTTDNGKFNKIKSKTIIYTGSKFLEIAASGVISASNIYQNISNIGYSFLQKDGHLDFKF